MTIAARIRELDAMGQSRAEIAYTVERSLRYVSAVLCKHKKREAAGRKGLTVKIGRPRKSAGRGAMTRSTRP